MGREGGGGGRSVDGRISWGSHCSAPQDAETIKRLNENGQLKAMLEGFEERPSQDCGECGGVGYVPCRWCQGSKKSLSNPFEKTDRSKRALKCTLCNEIGLQVGAPSAVRGRCGWGLVTPNPTVDVRLFPFCFRSAVRAARWACHGQKRRNALVLRQHFIIPPSTSSS